MAIIKKGDDQMSYEMLHTTDPVVHEEQVDQFELKKAGFWTRFWAYVIDLIVISAIGGILVKPVFYWLELPITNPIFLVFSPYKTVMLIIAICYFLLMTMFFKQTVGKMALGIKVVAQNGEPLTAASVFFREVIGRFISKVLVIPYLLVAFTSNKQALHDLFADTYVVHEQAYERKKVDSLAQQAKREQLQEQPNI